MIDLPNVTRVTTSSKGLTTSVQEPIKMYEKHLFHGDN